MIEHVTITMHPEIAQKIRNFCEDKDMSVSAVCRRGALELMERVSKNAN